jgi:glycerophosphoryl diester phosphodiesterase
MIELPNSVIPKIVAHRGASKAEKENTVAAFRRAVEMGADMVELDVRRTADGHMMVHHDPLVEGVGLISVHRRDDLPAYIPTLDEALDACAGIEVNVEIKSDKSEADYDPSHRLTAQVVELLLGRDDGDQMLVSSFDADVLRLVRSIAPSIATGFLYTASALPGRLIDRCVAEGHHAIHPYAIALTAGTVTKARSAGLQVNTWTVDDPDRMRVLAGWGVTAIITNVPDVARSALGRGPVMSI